MVANKTEEKKEFRKVPLPPDLQREIGLTDNARTVLQKRYIRKNEDGSLAETEEEMFWRVAYHVALADKELGKSDESVNHWARKYYDLLTELRFFPNSPTFTGAGTPLGQLAACFTADMRVTTEQGMKRIADLQIGDRVLTHEGRYRPVTELFQRAYSGELLRIKTKQLGTTMEVTPEHPILTPQGWVKAGQLKVGDKVVVAQEVLVMAYAGVAELEATHDYSEIHEITAEHFNGTVYNCEVDEDHTYVTEGVVVHNCFVLPIEDDMGRSPDGIFQTLRNAALIQQTGGGNGFSFSRLRPRGSVVKSSNGAATGPLGFLRVYDQAFGEIAQGGCLTPDTLIFTSKGLLRLDEMIQHEARGWMPHEYQIPTDEGIYPSYQGYNNGVAPVLKIKTDTGIELTGTPNHKLQVMTEHGAVWKHFEDLQPGDALMVKLGQHMGEIQTLAAPSKRHGNQVMPNFPTVLEEELAFFIGYLMGDGFIASGEDDKRVGVAVAHTSYLMDEMPNLIHHLFGENLHIHIQQKQADASVTLTVDNRALKNFLLMNGFEKPYSAFVRVPRLIRQSPPHIVAAFLRGLFEADGSVSHGYPQLVSSSENLIREVATLLIGLGCPVRISQVAHSDSRYGNSQMWSLRVHSFEGLKIWQKLVGSHEKSRFMACVNFVPDLSREVSYVLPFANYWIHPVLEATTLPQIDKRGRGKNLRSSQPSLRRRLLRYARGERQLTLSGYQILKEEFIEFAENARSIDDVWFIYVESVENAGEALTLDFEVADVHKYLANGIVSSNSRRGANMAVLRVDHPDIRDFIKCKSVEGAIENFNISVGITDIFMRAVEDDTTYDLINPQDGTVWETVRAREIFDMIVEYAHHNGEPGVLFLDTANRENPVPHLYELESTNPCVTGDTLIFTSKGLRRAQELFDDETEFEVVLDGRFGVERTTVPSTRVFKTGTKTVYRLQTKEGYAIRATADHRIMTDQGWVALKDLQVGVSVHILNRKGGFGVEGSLEEGRVLAGQMTAKTLAYGQTAILEREAVADEILQGNEAMQRGFLQTIFTENSLFGQNITLKTHDMSVLEAVQILLLNFGIVSTQTHSGLAISESNLAVFAHEIGFLSADLQASLESYIWQTALAPENFTATIESISVDGVEDVFDLTEPISHSFVGNGVVLHNCGEQFLGDYENCCLGSVNLAQHYTPDGKVDWEKLQDSVETSTRFLDHVVTANAYVPSVPQLKEAADRVRRIGLGIMGLGDLMYAVGVRYGSKEGQEFASQIMEFVRYHTMKTSIDLAREYHPFPAIEGSRYDQNELQWTIPTPLVPHVTNWGRPKLDWKKIQRDLKKYGIRNGAQLTVAPTGCLIPGSLVVTDRGLLPIESLGNIRGQQWQDIQLNVASEGGIKPATQFYINGRDHTIKVTTQRGYKLQGTDKHRIRVWEDGIWVWRRMDELKPGMKVPLQANGLIGEPQPVLLNTTITTDFHASQVTLPKQMSPDLAYLVGFFMGDGSLKVRSLRFAVSDNATINRLTNLLESLFAAKVKVSTDNRSTKLVSVDVHSLNLVEFWRNNGFAKAKPTEEHTGKGYHPHIPMAVLQTNDAEIYRAFLAGLFDADGTVSQAHHLTWTTTNEQFHDQVKTMLLTLGILTTSDLQTTGLGQSIAYRLRTASADMSIKIAQQLTYLCRAMPSIPVSRRKTLGDTIPLTMNEFHKLQSVAELGLERQRVQSWRGNGLRVSRESLSNFVKAHHDELYTDGLHNFIECIDQPIFYDEIAFVEDGGWQDTYDISVPDTHAYLANGFISHNTISTVSGCEGYGCEPVFALAYIRYMVNNAGNSDDRIPLQYTSPLFQKALNEANLSEAQIKSIVEKVNNTGTCQNIPELPENIRNTFVVASDISVEEHIWMQAVMQAYVDNAISKTINAPATATEEDVAKAYMLGWKLGCKGLTVYVTGSRDKVVLETKETLEKKKQQEQAVEIPADASPLQIRMFNEDKKPRPRRLVGKTFRTETPAGTTYITINENGEGPGQPFEVFIHTAKAGSEVTAVAEAMGRILSYLLRLASPVSPHKRLQEVMRQLKGIGGDSPLGFGPNRVRSLPDGLSQIFEEYLNETAEAAKQSESEPSPYKTSQQPMLIKETSTLKVNGSKKTPLGDLCPECGAATLVYEEGCQKCYSCGFSKC